MAGAGEPDTWVRGCREERQRPAKEGLGGLGYLLLGQAVLGKMVGEKTNWEARGEMCASVGAGLCSPFVLLCPLVGPGAMVVVVPVPCKVSCSYPGAGMQGMAWIAPPEQGLSALIHVPPS